MVSDHYTHLKKKGSEELRGTPGPGTAQMRHLRKRPQVKSPLCTERGLQPPANGQSRGHKLSQHRALDVTSQDNVCFLNSPEDAETGTTPFSPTYPHSLIHPSTQSPLSTRQVRALGGPRLRSQSSHGSLPDPSPDPAGRQEGWQDANQGLTGCR